MQCKHCKFAPSDVTTLLNHYRLKHAQGHQGKNWTCPYSDCVCNFRTSGTLKSHIARNHVERKSITITSTFKCDYCSFLSTCSALDFFTHLRGHLRNGEEVTCPFVGCYHKINSVANFNIHKCRKHKNHTDTDIKSAAPLEAGSADTGCHDYDFNDGDEGPSMHTEADEPFAENFDIDALEHKLASLFLSMQTVLHVTKNATQKIILDLYDIEKLANELAVKKITDICTKHGIDKDSEILQEITGALFECNPIIQTTSERGRLSTQYRRDLYFQEHFSILKPTEYLYDRTCKESFIYVPINDTLNNMLCNVDFVDKIVFNQSSTSGQLNSFQDGHFYKANALLSEEDPKMSLGLYIDEFEVCNPLGTSKKEHKIVAMYWVLLNLLPKYRSSLTSIQLAVLGKSDDVHNFGYEKFLSPLTRDIQLLEQNGVFVPRLNQNVKGTVFCVCADNLGANSLAGFVECFSATNYCRFCVIDKKDVKSTRIRDFKLRTIEEHNSHVEMLQSSGSMHPVFGVKRECALSKALSYFHPVTGFPPDVLHDLFEGIVPEELAVCLQALIAKGLFTHDELNKYIKTFPYQGPDKVNKPKIIAKSCFKKGTIGGNAHENWTLLRLLPLIIGHRIPENEPCWEILMDLKVIVELAVCASFSEETLSYMSSLINDHRNLVIETFPDFSIRPKHHFVDHYPHLIHCFGPLVSLWTMRFEAKHSYFKKVVHDTQNFKNVLLTLGTKHQEMQAYYSDRGELFWQSVYIENAEPFSTCNLDETLRSAVEKKYPNTDSVSVSSDVMLLRVYISPDNIRRVKLPGLPESVDRLKNILRELLGLEGGFSLQFEDPDFGNALCNLHSIDELPADKSVLKVVWDNIALSDSPTQSPARYMSDTSSVTSLDTASTSSHSDTLGSPTFYRKLKTAKDLPSPGSIQIPTFSLDVELRLKQGNEIYRQTKTPIAPSREMKSAICTAIVESIFATDCYPDKADMKCYAAALVTKHPCLTEDGPGTGYDGWLVSLWFKVGNYRNKLRKAGHAEVSVNKKKADSEEGMKFRLKKARRAEVNFLPPHAEGQSHESLDDLRLQMTKETEKKIFDANFIKDTMAVTFSLRRREVVEIQPLVQVLRDRWPALFHKDEICREFFRITQIDLMTSFRSSLEKFTPALLKYYRKKKEHAGSELTTLLAPLDDQDTDAEETYTKGVKISILSVLEDDGVAARRSLPNVLNIAIILEEAVVLKDIKDLPSAVGYLIGLLYACNMEYPKELRYTFEVIQKVFLELDAQDCSARALSLRRKIFEFLR
ncbi:hypothetical protein ACEWY4_001208 [Coilia grayii]|uniref:C2H2-type domain-containing protein n=1 Tax=Coilia grayii TaxID=363190 RepID=A0ABD1KYV3_9TELE